MKKLGMMCLALSLLSGCSLRGFELLFDMHDNTVEPAIDVDSVLVTPWSTKDEILNQLPALGFALGHEIERDDELIDIPGRYESSSGVDYYFSLVYDEDGNVSEYVVTCRDDYSITNISEIASIFSTFASYETTGVDANENVDFIYDSFVESASTKDEARNYKIEKDEYSLSVLMQCYDFENASTIQLIFAMQ